MGCYTFMRGLFGRWGVPMWSGETQAFKLIRMLQKQGYTKILYEEGPLLDANWTDLSRSIRYRVALTYGLTGGHLGGAEALAKASNIRWQGPRWFKVTFGKEAIDAIRGGWRVPPGHGQECTCRDMRHGLLNNSTCPVHTMGREKQ